MHFCAVHVCAFKYAYMPVYLFDTDPVSFWADNSTDRPPFDEHIWGRSRTGRLALTISSFIFPDLLN